MSLRLTRPSLCHKLTRKSTQLLVTLSSPWKLRVHKGLVPLLRHRTKEDSWALVLALDSSVLLRSYQRQRVKGNVAGGGSGLLGQHWVEKEGRSPSISKSGFSSEKHNQSGIYEEIYYGDWLTWLWRLWSLTIYLLHTGESGKPVLVWRAKNQELWGPRAGREGYPRSKREKECALCLFVLLDPSTNWRVDLYSICWFKSFPETSA